MSSLYVLSAFPYVIQHCKSESMRINLFWELMRINVVSDCFLRFDKNTLLDAACGDCSSGFQT
ncbi:hypothetical protein SPHINGO391_410102 [Sphingomonas aurantiaca]|uniref:Uncharacterized protein n=1 Tax=Sphingomonas aurantiaca TaxID=185949 RepID=A0A5E7YYH0_9SPHN|nr:hypothetical protein SPHINGO391_410102 [Sphingomonas aurantiaca]